MDDRANIAVKQPGPEDRVYLYTHWRGTELPATLQKALARKQRWDDHAYLARIIFCAMVKGSEHDETGFGISTAIGDNDGYPILVIDTETKTVTLEDEDTGVAVASYTFATFIELPDVEWTTLVKGKVAP